jgi:ABC-2 type transport system permease protein
MGNVANVWALARREVQSYFSSPVAYVVLALFIFLFGYFFSDYLFVFLERSMGRGGFGGPSESLNLNQDLIRFVYLSASVVLLFLVPMLTMRAFAEEIRSGTIELLLTSPLTDFQIVLGKFLGALFLYAAMLLLTSLHMAILFFFGDPEWKPILVGYLGMLLLGSAFISFGLVFSSLTRNQIVAGFLTFGTFLFLWLLSVRGESAGAAAASSPTSGDSAPRGFTKGRDREPRRDYHLTFIGLGLFPEAVLESLRWRG